MDVAKIEIRECLNLMETQVSSVFFPTICAFPSRGCLLVTLSGNLVTVSMNKIRKMVFVFCRSIDGLTWEGADLLRILAAKPVLKK